jgi:hypothetical protein
MKHRYWVAVVALMLAASHTADAKTMRQPKAWHPVHHDRATKGTRAVKPKYRLKIAKQCQTASCFKKHPSGTYEPRHLKDSQ